MEHILNSFCEVSVLKFIFNMELRPKELNAFRGAVGRLMQDKVLFHQHRSERSYLQRYPLVQYRFVRQRPAVICLNEAIEESRILPRRLGKYFTIYHEKRPVSLHKQESEKVRIGIARGSKFFYEIPNWLALNDNNFRRYKNIRSESERIALLRKIFRDNMLSLGKGIGWHIEEEVQVYELEIHRIRSVYFKRNISRLCFSVRVSCNVLLSECLGIGKGVSRGYGQVIPLFS